ncbi:hypothetical protein RUM43_014016 [Polyplax serrata]|uniref:Uncharacterized protein n=1 Tax=Polyplax serrata TaxID=468196 RepID=A0AAN8NQ22_POLSC
MEARSKDKGTIGDTSELENTNVLVVVVGGTESQDKDVKVARRRTLCRQTGSRIREREPNGGNGEEER